MRRRQKYGKRVLVTYASKYGSTGGVADAIGKELCGKGLAADVALIRNAGDLGLYQGGVVGSAIYRGKWMAEATVEYDPRLGNTCTNWGVSMKFVSSGKEIWADMQMISESSYGIQIIERQTMKQDIVINAAALQRGLAATGHIAVYDIFFDTGQSDIKPQSDATLKEIAKLGGSQTHRRRPAVDPGDTRVKPLPGMLDPSPGLGCAPYLKFSRTDWQSRVPFVLPTPPG